MSLEARRELVATGTSLMECWPEAFVDFAATNGIQHYNLTDTSVQPPSWMRDAIDGNLRGQKRGTTREHVRTAVAALQAEGRATTKVNVRELLGCKYPTALDAVLARRDLATAEDLERLIGVLAAAEKQSFRRLSSRLTALRNCALAGAVTLLQRSAEELSEMPVADVKLELLGLEGLSSAAIAARGQLVHWIGLFETESVKLWPAPSRGLFRAVRTGQGFVRSVERCLGKSIRAVDPLLRRDYTAFRDALRAPP